MGKYGKDAYGVPYKITAAEPGTDVLGELREAERAKVDLARRYAKEIGAALERDDYDTALDRTQLLYTAIVHAGNAAQIAERYAPVLATLPISDPHEVKP